VEQGFGIESERTTDRDTVRSIATQIYPATIFSGKAFARTAGTSTSRGIPGEVAEHLSEFQGRRGRIFVSNFSAWYRLSR
jgi:hypothetical protein